MFYWSREYTESLEEGQDYKELPDVIAINVVNFDYPPVRNSHTRFHLREDLDHDIVLTDALEIHFLNMVQYRRRQRKKILLDNALNRWLVWLDEGSPPDLIAEVLKMDSSIKAADKRLNIINKDKEFLRYYRLRQMALSDYTSNMNSAREEGEAKGRTEGRAEGKTEIARNALAEGLSIDIIRKITGLSPEEIAKL